MPRHYSCTNIEGLYRSAKCRSENIRSKVHCDIAANCNSSPCNETFKNFQMHSLDWVINQKTVPAKAIVLSRNIKIKNSLYLSGSFYYIESCKIKSLKVNKYSRTLVARTQMARSPLKFRARS